MYSNVAVLPVEPRLGIGLVLAVTVATCGPTTHLDSEIKIECFKKATPTFGRSMIVDD